MEDLKVEVGADISKYVNAMNAAGGSTEKFASDAARSVTKISGNLDKLEKKSYTARFAVQNLGNTIRDIPFAAANPAILTSVLDHLVDSFANLKQEAGSTKGAFKLLGESISGGGGLLIGFNLVSLAATYLIPKLFEASDASKAAAEAAKKLKESLNGIFSQAGKEAAEVSGLIAVLKNETETRQRKLDAIKELQRISPEIFSQLKLEQGAVTGLDAAYQNYLANLKTVMAAKLVQAELENKITKLLQLQGVKQTSLDTLNTLVKSFRQAGSASGAMDLMSKSAGKNDKEIRILNSDIDDLNTKLQELSKGISVTTTKPTAVKAAETVSDVLAKLQNQLRVISQEEIIFRTDKVKEKVSAITGTIGTLLDKFKLSADSQVVIGLKIGINEAEERSRVRKLMPEIIKKDDPWLNIPLTVNTKHITESVKKMTVVVTDEMKAMSASLADTFANLSEGIGVALGDALGGKGDLFSNVFKGIFDIMGTFLINLGKAAIVASDLYKAILTSVSSPITGIIAGIAAIAAGEILKSIKFPGFAAGGFINGPGTSTSDSINARLSVGEYIVNANSVKKYGRSFFDMINGGGFSRNGNYANGGPVNSGSIGGGQLITVEVVGNLRGETIYLANKRAALKIGRNG